MDVDVKPEEQDVREPKRESSGSAFEGFPGAPTPEEKAALVGDVVKPKRGRPPRAVSEAKLKQALVQNFTLLGVGVSAFNQYDGAVILKKADQTSDALIALANENPKVKKALESLLTASTWSQVALALGGMAIPIAANHGMVPPQFCTIFQVPPPPVEGRASRSGDSA